MRDVDADADPADDVADAADSRADDAAGPDDADAVDVDVRDDDAHDDDVDGRDDDAHDDDVDGRDDDADAADTDAHDTDAHDTDAHDADAHDTDAHDTDAHDADAADGSGEPAPTCADLACGAHETCVDDDAPRCVCADDALRTVEGACIAAGDDPCASAPCGPGTCAPSADGYLCVCPGEQLDYTHGEADSEGDCVVPGLVCITRSSRWSIYNGVVDEPTGGSDHDLPSRTAWAMGSCDEATTFGSFMSGAFARRSPPSVVDDAACLRIPDAEGPLAVNLTFTQFASGGRFAYRRDVVRRNLECPAPTE